MSTWQMTAAHFRYILEDVQDYRCNISGLELLPENTCIALKIPRSRKGKPGPDNIQLVHESIVQLARDLPVNEAVEICKIVAKHNR